MSYYYTAHLFFFGYFVCLLPSTKGEHWLVLPALIIVCFVAALVFPLTLSALFVALQYEKTRRRAGRTWK